MISLYPDKYKRFFVFGCSFTSHQYPTWANVIHQELNDCKIYNFGMSGAGNMCIISRLSQVNQKYKFCETDLVMIMFSSFTREDRYINGNWKTTGNVFNNSFYDDNFIKKYTDPAGYLLRDCSFITMTIDWLNNLKCDSQVLFSYDLDTHETDLSVNLNQESDEMSYLENLHNIKKTYKSLFENSPISFWNYWKNNKDLGHTYYHPVFDGVTYDPHPSPLYYYKYLKHVGFNLTDRSKNYALRSHDKLKECRSLFEILHNFSTEQELRKHNSNIF